MRVETSLLADVVIMSGNESGHVSLQVSYCVGKSVFLLCPSLNDSLYEWHDFTYVESSHMIF